MKKEKVSNPQKQVKKLCLIWVISYIIIGIASNAYVIYMHIYSGNPPTTPLGYPNYSVMAVCAFFFIPFAYFINRRAKAAEMRKIAIASKAVVIIMSVWLVLALVFTLIAAFVPGIAG